MSTWENLKFVSPQSVFHISSDSATFTTAMIRCFQALFFAVLAIAIVRSQDNCKKIGPQCSPDGDKVWFCTEVDKQPEEEACEEGEKCKEEEDRVACMKPSSDNLRFKCTGKGEFPDPKDCSRTFICNEGKDTPTEVCNCPGGGFVYPEQGLPCVPDGCPRKEIACSEGDSGFFELINDEKTGYYYYCSKPDVVEVYEGVEVPDGDGLRRTALKNGKECKPFDDSNSTTAEPTTTTSKPETSETTTTTEVSSTTTTKATETTSPTAKPTETTTKSTIKPTQPTPTTPKPEQTPKCTKQGELYETECDCDFYECDKKLVPKRRTCRSGMLYNPKLKRCIYGECDESKCIHRPK